MDSDYANYLLQKVQTDYNQIAERFSKTRSKLWPELLFLKDYVKEKDRVLDVGCGNGRLYELFRDKQIQYFGVDFAKRLIEIAKRKYSDWSDDTSIPTFLRINALNLPFESNFFDKIFSISVFHHIPSTEKRILFLKEMKRVLKPEGELFLTVWNLWQRRYLPLILKYFFLKVLGRTRLDFFDIFLPFEGVERYYHCFRPGELEKIATEAGFKIIELKYLKRNNKKYNIYLRAKKR